MSKNLQHFVDNFLRGMEVGNRMQDRWANQQYRREALDVQRARNAQAAAIHADKMGIERARLGGYLQDVQGRYIKNTTPKAGKAGPAAPSAAQEAWRAQNGAPDYGVPQAQPVQVTVEAPEPDTPTPEPRSAYGETPEFARGGLVRKPAQAGGTGTNGPGSGYGDRAVPPPMAFRPNAPATKGRGAPRAYAEGGLVTDDTINAQLPPPPDEPLWTPQGDVAREVAIETVRNRRLEAAQRGLPVGEDTPPPGMERRYGGARYGGNRFGGNRFGGQTFGQSHGMNLPRDRDAPMPTFRNPSDPINRTVDEMPGWLRQDWQGEEDRADETQPAPPRDPGETGGFPEMQPADRTVARYKMIEPRTAPAGGGGARGGGRGGAINTGWKPLRDQTRTAAYDPEKDLYDPDNVHATATPLQGAATYADRVFHQGQGQVQGQTSGEGAPTNSLAERGKHALYSGTGAADPKMMQQVFQTVDPQGTMPMEQKLTAAVKAVHDFYMKTGDTENANKSAFEVAQFGNAQAREHGKQALQLMQSGNMQGATDALIKGYNWLPDGKTASAENGQVVIRDEGGQTVAAYPLDPKAMQNIALGMASGQLGWDVIRMGSTAPPGAGAQPAASPPAQAQVAAQPAAAPAGPSQIPAAPATVTTPSRPSPPAAAPGAAASVPPAHTPAAPAPTAGPQTAKPAGETTLPAQGDSIPGQAIDTKRTAVSAPLPGEYKPKSPFDAPPGVYREQAPEPDRITPVDVKAEIDRRQKILDADLARAAIEGARAGIKPAEIRAGAAHKQKQFDAMRKELLDGLKAKRAEQERLDAGERAALKPRDVPVGAEEQFATTMAGRIDQLAAEAQKTFRSAGPEKEAGDRRAAAHAVSVLRWAVDPKDKETLNRVATGIWRHNHGNSTSNALDDAVTLTSIRRPVDENGKLLTKIDPKVGVMATQFTRLQNDPLGNVVLQLPTGRTIRMDKNSFQDLRSLHARNWKQYVDEAEKKNKSDEVNRKAGEAIKTVVPDLTPSLSLPY